MIPTGAELANLAAVMASPSEDPDVTARRAMKLWEACEQELHRAKSREEKSQADGNREFDEFQDDCQFLHSVKLGKCVNFESFNPNLDYPIFEPGERVTLETLLKIVMPPSKIEDRMAKWRAFRRLNVIQMDGIQGLSERSESQLLDAVDSMMKRDDEEGFPCSISLLAIWKNFTTFLEHDRKFQRSEASKKGGRPKKVLGSDESPEKPPQV